MEYYSKAKVKSLSHRKILKTTVVVMDFFELLFLVLPAYASNSIPVVLGGGTKIDLGKNFFDGKRVFGDSKTIRGFISGVAAGTLVGVILALGVGFLPWIPQNDKFVVGFLVSLGAMAGDLLGSFVKRRLGLSPGSQYFLLDQLLFIILALVFAIAFAPKILAELNGWDVLALMVLTYFLHLSFNWIAHKLRLKKVPW
ncbi:MAG TPA: CDP-2,3-bis-(O-geranylgeranyl)-sn-glycerol synthase [Candidatus Norongarragalinales archaeon]|nr:CDP-2,3-bis-(O-geranylgeranyl)-sn-glycerol synthase [Candidatus Norongarragalinales archaeon]